MTPKHTVREYDCPICSTPQKVAEHMEFWEYVTGPEFRALLDELVQNPKRAKRMEPADQTSNIRDQSSNWRIS